MNGDGGAGIELQYDRQLKGEDGLFSFNVDARRRSFRVKVEKPPVQGHSLVLSIDKSIQYIADRELAAGVKKARGSAGVAIVMEPESGRILALSNYPQFNSNTYNKYKPDLWRNRAVSDLFEPGSTFKVVVAAAALEAGLARPNEVIDCQMGSIIIGNHVFHDHKPYQSLSHHLPKYIYTCSIAPIVLLWSKSRQIFRLSKWKNKCIKERLIFNIKRDLFLYF